MQIWLYKMQIHILQSVLKTELQTFRKKLACCRFDNITCLSCKSAVVEGVPVLDCQMIAYILQLGPNETRHLTS